MAFEIVFTVEASKTISRLRAAAESQAAGGRKSKVVGLFNQVVKCIDLLRANPRHPGLRTHEFHSIPHPYAKGQKVFEAYVQNRTPGAYRLFWCYGPKAGQITVLAITPHP
jgi:hypothetical protein